MGTRTRRGAIGKETERKLQQLSREPFREALAELLDARPTHDELREYAGMSPDRYWQAIAVAGRLAGYSDKIVHEYNYYVKIEQMSDAELNLELKRNLELIEKARAGETLEGEFEKLESFSQTEGDP